MKETPILMRPEMSRATRLGMKFETRRLTGLEAINENPEQWKVRVPLTTSGDKQMSAIFINSNDPSNPIQVLCAYGKVDDLLWVRETWNKDGFGSFLYKADFIDDEVMRWKPSLHMHKVAARTWCQITEIKLERLHDVTVEGAKDEGIDLFFEKCAYRIPSRRKGIKFTTDDPVNAYITYVNSINNLSMNDNPWVWVLKYQVLSTTGRPSMSQFHEDYMTTEFKDNQSNQRSLD